MEFSLQLQEIIVFFALLFAIICLYVATNTTKRKKERGRRPPEPEGTWPLIGHLHLLAGSDQLLHQTLGHMADKYGKAFMIRLGIKQALVVTHREVAKECFTTNDKVFSSSPKFLAVKIMGYGHAMLGFAPYGSYWRDVSKLAKIELLSSHRLEVAMTPQWSHLHWALSLLLNNRHVLREAQNELDIHVGRHRQVEESDIKNLIYLQAIVKETMRLYPAIPLSAPRESMEDCTIAGFHIPAGTQPFTNLWKMHRDPSIWENPSEFIPERFLNENTNLDVGGQNFEYWPFGSCRRKCPGISFALQVLHLTLARLLHAFELGTVSDTLVDMSGSPGMTS